MPKLKKWEVRAGTDTELKLNDLFKYYDYETSAAKDLLYRFVVGSSIIFGPGIHGPKPRTNKNLKILDTIQTGRYLDLAVLGSLVRTSKRKVKDFCNQIIFRRQKTMENLEKRNRELEMARVKNKDIIQCEQRQQVSTNISTSASD